MCLECWEDRSAFQTHLGTPNLAAFAAAIADFVISRKVEVIHPDHVETL